MVPATVQNLVMRDYTAKNDFVFKLAVDEHAFPGCYMRLNAIVDELAEVDGLVMCSAHMLPKRRSRRRSVLLRAFERDAEVHCVFESLVIRGDADIAALDEMFYLLETLQQCPKKIAEELLGPAKGNDSFS